MDMSYDWIQVSNSCGVSSGADQFKVAFGLSGHQIFKLSEVLAVLPSLVYPAMAV